jgi:hypothetical protein
VSRMHAVIEVNANGDVEIADLNSTNGTFVNGDKITRKRLNSGDQIRVGDIRLVVDIIQKSPNIKQQKKFKKASTALPAQMNPLMYLDLPESESIVGGRECIEVIRVWCGTVQDALHTEKKSKPITLGSAAENTFVISPDLLVGENPCALVTFENEEPRLHLDEAFSGKVKIADEILDVDSARATHGASIVLSPKTRAVLSISDQYFLVSYQELPPKPRTSFYKKLELKDQAYTALSMALHMLFMILLSMVPEQELIGSRDHAERRAMMIRSIQVAEIERLEEEEEILEKKEEIKIEKVARKDRQKVQKKVTKVVKAKKKDRKDLTKKEKEKVDRDKAKDTGILKAMNDDSLALLNDPVDDLLAPGELSGVIIASADPNAPTITSFQAFSGNSGPNGGGGDSDFLLPQGSIASGSGGTKGMVSGLDKASINNDGSVGAGGLKKKKRKVKVDILTPEVSGAYDKEAVRRVIRAAAGQIRWCYQQALQRDPNLGGKVVLGFLIAPTGGVQAPKIKSNTMQNSSVGECIRKKSRLWKFPPPPDSGVVTVSYPFLFKAKK